MRKYYILSVLSLFLLVPASITWAQTVTSQKGLTTIEFNLPHGTIRVYLPDDIRPGDIISGSFKVDPTGGNAKQQQRSMNELLKSKLKIGDPLDPSQVAESLLQRYKPDFRGGVIKSENVELPYAVSLTDGNNKTISVPIKLRTAPLDNTTLSSTCSLPTHALTGSPMRITGPFDGDLSNTKCMVGEQPLPVIAESPRSCTVAFPSNAKGEQTTTIKENGKEPCTGKISGVDIAVSTGKMNLLKGEKTYLDVTITGLQNLPDTALLSLDNRTTGVIVMQPANNIVIPLAPDSVSSGIYRRRFDIQSIKTGIFTVNVNLDLPGIVYDLRNVQFGLTQNPGSYGWRGDDPCENKGPITWRWHRTLPCAIELKVMPYGTTPAEKEIIDFIIDKFKELSKKGGDLGSKMSKCLSFKDKAFSMFARCYRDWDDWDVTYICVNGKWVQTSMVYVRGDREYLSDWIPLRNAGGNNEWFKSDKFGWLAEAIEKAVRCCD